MNANPRLHPSSSLGNASALGRSAARRFALARLAKDRDCCSLHTVKAFQSLAVVETVLPTSEGPPADLSERHAKYAKEFRAQCGKIKKQYAEFLQSVSAEELTRRTLTVASYLIGREFHSGASILETWHPLKRYHTNEWLPALRGESSPPPYDAYIHTRTRTHTYVHSHVHTHVHTHTYTARSMPRHLN